MANLARRNGLIWDTILDAEVARDHKPKPVVYLASAAAFDGTPRAAMMVAAPSSDLAAACGMRTAFIAQADEHGPGRGETRARVPVDVSAATLVALAAQLGPD